MKFPNPKSDIRRAYFKNKGVAPEKLTEMVTATKGLSFAELKEGIYCSEVMGKPLEDVIKRIKEPFKSKDYLHKVQKN